MIYVYRPTNSTGARELAEGITLEGTLARRTKGQRLRALEAGDTVVCWGANFAATPNTKTLNNVEPISKFAEAQKLAAAEVPTVQVSRNRPPAAEARPRPAARPNWQVPVGLRGVAMSEARVRELLGAAQLYLAAPLPVQPAIPAATWLPRKNRHVGGNDLLTDNLENPDFYSKKEEIVEEYRLHMFGGKSIRAGKKFARATRPDGRTPAHAWIRSFDAGWIITYDGFESTKAMRDIAAKALKALGLDFAAVDLGKRADGSLIVLEVNRAPGVEGGTIKAYAKHIIAWASGVRE